MGKPTSNDLKIQDYEQQLEKQKKSIDQKEQQISEIKNEVNICAKKLKSYEEKPVYGECTPFGDAPGIHKITPDQKDPFDVLCDSATAGPGWTVIQQRINGKEDFYRDWATYRNGFGAFDGDFFLGLEKIHRLTSAQLHELYIHMKGFDGIAKYYRYEQFAIAGEEDQYRLSISGKAGHNAYDELGFHDNQKFSTYDRDNDAWDDGNCATSRATQLLPAEAARPQRALDGSRSRIQRPVKQRPPHATQQLHSTRTETERRKQQQQQQQ
ncbi:ficolin-2-like [Drosophila novamexicana]|uniref:ficolin-2-like n=1 Tax=Drosophila novamexicana TaxID=47314 RepID=UPI0011E5DBC1|nr:ficolin-2-like [Drosophila novamexicana]